MMRRGSAPLGRYSRSVLSRRTTTASPAVNADDFREPCQLVPFRGLATNTPRHVHCGNPFTVTRRSSRLGPRRVAFITTDTNESAPAAPKSGYNKPWFDRKRSLFARVEQFVEAPRLHPGDLTSREIADLVKECCVLNTIEGMHSAQEIVDRLLVEKRRWKTQGVLIPVPVTTFQLILYGWACLCSSSENALSQMKDVLDLVVDEAKDDARNEGDTDASSGQPTVQLFNTYLQGLSNAAMLSREVAIEAEAMVNVMLGYHRTLGWHTKPNSRTFTQVIAAFSNSRRSDAGTRAVSVLRRMQRAHAAEKERYMEDYGVPYNTLEPDSNHKQIVTADAVAYTATISALVHGKPPVEKAERLLNEMLESEAGKLNLDAAPFAMVIKAHGEMAGDTTLDKDKRKAATVRAEAILWLMNDHLDRLCLDGEDQPTTPFDALPAFNACLDALARADTREAAPKSEHLLRKMLASGDTLPNTTSFNACLSAWSRSSKFYPHSADRTELLLALQHELCSSGRLDETAKPDLQSYAITILSHAYADRPEKVAHARRLLDSMLASIRNGEIVVSRNASAPFSAVLTAASRSQHEGDQSEKAMFEDVFNSEVDTETDAYSIALRTYNELKDDVHRIGAKPDHHVFGIFLRCIARHCPPQSVEREQMSKLVFEEACGAGQVSRLVVEALAAMDMMNLVQVDSISNVTELPKLWWTNVSPGWRKLAVSRRRNK